ncbi:hypothetical protein BGAL_0202g00020 [Botrytis galanthina]|uniref:Uncharacterized protein n=1 Tax=Botrytis galanthina TaxID=278940 RepID=A0A4S8R7Q3_9HELO|nr:hypothetical protein BGAL_0202g00020 [Botrytis galanthina]
MPPSQAQAQLKPPTKIIPDVSTSRGEIGQEMVKTLDWIVRRFHESLYLKTVDKRDGQLELRNSSAIKIRREDVEKFAEEATEKNEKYRLEVHGGVRGDYTFTWKDKEKEKEKEKKKKKKSSKRSQDNGQVAQ